MKKRVSIDVKDVRVGDRVKVRGYAECANKWHYFDNSILLVKAVEYGIIRVRVTSTGVDCSIDRLNILSAERDIEETPTPGTWQDGIECRVYRATGWSTDTRRKDIKFAPGRPCKVIGWGDWRGARDGATRWTGHETGVTINSLDIYREDDVIVEYRGSQCAVHERNVDVIERRRNPEE